MCPYSLHQDAIRTVLYHLCQDVEVITYRQAILKDLLHQPIFIEALRSMMPLLDERCFSPTLPLLTKHHLTRLSSEQANYTSWWIA